MTVEDNISEEPLQGSSAREDLSLSLLGRHSDDQQYLVAYYLWAALLFGKRVSLPYNTSQPVTLFSIEFTDGWSNSG